MIRTVLVALVVLVGLPRVVTTETGAGKVDAGVPKASTGSR